LGAPTLPNVVIQGRRAWSKLFLAIGPIAILRTPLRELINYKSSSIRIKFKLAALPRPHALDSAAGLSRVTPHALPSYSALCS